MYTRTLFILLFICAVYFRGTSSQVVNGVDWTSCPVACKYYRRQQVFLYFTSLILFEARPIPLNRTNLVSVPSNLVSTVHSLFPEGSTPNALLVNPNTDAFIVLQTVSWRSTFGTIL